MSTPPKTTYKEQLEQILNQLIDYVDVGKGDMHKKKALAAITALNAETIGEDEGLDGYAPHNGERMAREDRNKFRANLRNCFGVES